MIVHAPTHRINDDKRNIPRCPTLNYGGEGWEKETNNQAVNGGGPTNNRLLTFRRVCWSFESASVATTGCQCIPCTHECRDCRLSPNKRSKHVLLTHCAPTLELPPILPSPVPLTGSECKLFQNNLHLSPSTHEVKKCHQLRGGTHVACSTQPYCRWYRLYAPGPAPFLASRWLNKRFLLEELWAGKAF